MKLIQTNFTYEFQGRSERGSYLGRKPAKERTLRAFLTKNAKHAGFKPSDFTLSSIGNSIKTHREGGA